MMKFAMAMVGAAGLLLRTAFAAAPGQPVPIVPGTYAGHFWSETVTIAVYRVQGGKVYGPDQAVFDNGGMTATKPFVATIGQDGRTFSWVDSRGSSIALSPCLGDCAAFSIRGYSAPASILISRSRSGGCALL
jgi:hypothetical protein